MFCFECKNDVFAKWYAFHFENTRGYQVCSFVAAPLLHWNLSEVERGEQRLFVQANFIVKERGCNQQCFVLLMRARGSLDM